MADWQRSHTCGELRESHIGQTVVLNGWVNTYRAHPDQVFIDLRDRYGLTQVVLDSDHPQVFAIGQEARSEWVLSVRGTVRERLPGKHNPKLATGDIEVVATELVVLNRCPNPPFETWSVPLEGGVFGDPDLAGEDLRLQYRYLDLRRATLQRTLAMRHRLNKTIRDYLDEQGFLELETPLLGRSTPEGARDYLVPSRVSPGHWYALPQSPQLYKQLDGGRLRPLLPDRPLSARRGPDRQPEFDLEFVSRTTVFAVIEGLTAATFRRCIDTCASTRGSDNFVMAWRLPDRPDRVQGVPRRGDRRRGRPRAERQGSGPTPS
ncbi:MAG: amino acid--tRNA ligase-related protein [Gemmataceae bacterium]